MSLNKHDFILEIRLQASEIKPIFSTQMPNHGILFQDGGLATIDVIGLHKKVEFDKRSDLTFVMGEGRDHNLPPGLETALEKMKRNERAHITLSPKYTFGKEGCPQLGVGPNEPSHLTYEARSFF